MLRSCNNKPSFARCVNRRYNKRKLVSEYKLQPHPRCSQRSNVELPPPPSRCFLEKKFLYNSEENCSSFIRMLALSLANMHPRMRIFSSSLLYFISADNALVKIYRDKPNRTTRMKNEIVSKERKKFSRIFFSME